MTINYDKFRQNLRNIIDSRGMTVKEFALEVDISQPTLSRYLTADRQPELVSVMKIAQYCGVSIDWLVGISGEKFEVLPEKVQEIAFGYSIASPDDRRVVEAVLNKYINKD